MALSSANGVEYLWGVAQLAAMVSAGYLTWLVTFERWIEPALRRWLGAVVGSPVRWVRIAGPLRNWGVGRTRSKAIEAGVGVAGGIAVAGSALVPAVTINVIVRAALGEGVFGATTYLMTVPVVGLFAARLLLGQADPASDCITPPRPTGSASTHG
jgi:hypothetical protein